MVNSTPVFHDEGSDDDSDHNNYNNHHDDDAEAAEQETLNNNRRSPSSRGGRSHDSSRKMIEGETNITEHRRGQLTRTLSQAAVAAPEDLCDIPDDVYSMFFLSSYGGPAFWYGAYVTALKVALYTFLTIDALDQPLQDEVEQKLLAAQFLMLPIAVAIQEDLCAFFFTVANVQYSPEIKQVFPGASYQKFMIANLFRGLDGFYSLLVNIVILLKADTVLTLFLNFAALQFLQTIDNIALHLCLDGYLGERLETIAFKVTQVKLPRKKNAFLNMLDSAFFMLCFVGLLAAWVWIQFF